MRLKKQIAEMFGSKKAAKYFLKGRKHWKKYCKYDKKVKELLRENGG